MPLFKKSKNDSDRRQAELELQQSTLSEIDNDGGVSSSMKYSNAGPWYTPTSINTVPFRSSTPRTSSSAGFSPASTLPSRGTSRTSSPPSSLPRSPPPVTVTQSPNRTVTSNSTNRTNSSAKIPRKAAESDRNKKSVPSKDATDSSTKSPPKRSGSTQGSTSPTPWATNGTTVKVITRDGEDDPEWLKLYKKCKKPLQIMLAVIIFILIIIIALAASSTTAAVDYDGAFAKLLGDKCVHTCRPGRYIEGFQETPLIVVALDGFRSDYLSKYREKLPNLRRLSECGVVADLRASFPATTSPNLWTIVSGYYPQFHGIVSEWILDYRTGEDFAPRVDPTGPGTVDAGWFHDPALWELAREQGKITASHSWIGNNLGVVEDDHHEEPEDRSPTYYKAFDSSVSYMSRIETVLEWLKLPANQRPTFTTVYFEDPGKTGRTYGALSAEVGEVLDNIDKAIGSLFDELMRLEVVDCVNFMLVSTSGMVDTNCDDVYYLSDDINNLNDFTISPDYLGSMARITPKDSAPYDLDTEDKITEYLQCKVDHGQAYLTDFLPSRLHGAYGHHLEELVVLMEDGWTFAKQQTGYNRDHCRGANDGYDPFSENMTGVFIAFGEDFKIGHAINPFQNTELFNLMTDLIGVKPSATAPPSDGNKGYLNDALKNPGANPVFTWGLSNPNNQMCQYPDERRVANEGCTCPANVLDMYPETAGINLEGKDANLNLGESRGLLERIAPFGLPGVKDDINTNGEYVCILYQNNYITGYDYFLEIPIFVSFTMESTTASVPVVENCLRYDQRLSPEKTPRCMDYKSVVAEYLHIEHTFLYQPSLAGNIDAEFDTLITSNVVPQYRKFTKEIWTPLADRIRDWAAETNHIQVIAGPAYDGNRDSKKDRYYDIGASNTWVGDTPVPTHYFLVVTRCQMQNNSVENTPLKDCTYDKLATMAYIFPHTEDIPQCFNFEEYLKNNRATVQDVERLSGLVFYTGWSMDSETQMQMIRFKAQFSNNSPWVEF